MGGSWTQFEAWLSMQTVSANGLRPAPPGERRCDVVPILGCNSNMVDGLIAMWAERTPEEAHQLLANPDVSVTCQKDKEDQLDTLARLSAQTRAVVNQGEPCEGHENATGACGENERMNSPLLELRLHGSCAGSCASV